MTYVILMDFDRAHIPEAIFRPVWLPFPWLSKTSLSPPLLVRAKERQRKIFDLLSLSPKIKDPVCLRKSGRINTRRPLSSCVQRQKSHLSVTALWPDFLNKVYKLLKRTVRLGYTRSLTARSSLPCVTAVFYLSFIITIIFPFRKERESRGRLMRRGR